MNVQVYGGPLDGAYVPYRGPEVRLASSPVTAPRYLRADDLPPIPPVRVETYTLQRRANGEPCYVRQPRHTRHAR